jgi:hypothetical protein
MSDLDTQFSRGAAVSAARIEIAGMSPKGARGSATHTPVQLRPFFRLAASRPRDARAQSMISRLARRLGSMEISRRSEDESGDPE